MSEENHEQRIASLEGARQNSVAMFELVNVLADFQKDATGILYEWIIALEKRNSNALKILEQSLPDGEARQRLKDILALNVFDRDQLEAMLQKYKSLRFPPSGPSVPPVAPRE